MIANDNALLQASGGRVMFHPFARWAAVSLEGVPLGYMVHRDDQTTLHLKADAPLWLRQVRDAGPFKDHSACQEAIKNAAPRLF